MKRFLPSFWILFLLIFPIRVTDCESARASEFEWEETPQSVALLENGKPIWRFHYGPSDEIDYLGKPFFHPVAVPARSKSDSPIVLTCNSPDDHPWHHGLWFSWKFLNGVNYWEVDRNTGKALGKTNLTKVATHLHNDFSAEISLRIEYIPGPGQPDAGEVILKEHRRIVITPPDEEGRYHFDWCCRFTAGEKAVRFDRTPLPGEPGGVGYGGYAGLSIRLSQSMTDRGAVSTKGPVEFNAQNRHRSKAKAMDYFGKIDKQVVGFAFCDHSENRNHPTPWYVIASNHMSYYSPAVICYEPFELEAERSFTLKYRAIAHRGKLDSEQLQAAYRDFAESTPSTASQTPEKK
jgi:hypothetical protein